MRVSPMRSLLALLLLALVLPPARAAEGPIDAAEVAALRAETIERSQAMDHIGWLADVFGPRLTGTPAIEAAGEWVAGRLREWGIEDVRVERFPFGRGWEVERFSLHLIEPQTQPLIAYPRSWSPGTGGPVEAAVVRVRIEQESDFERYRGRLRGRIVLTQPEREVRLLEDPVVLRMDDALLAEAAAPPTPEATETEDRVDRRERARLRARMQRFWVEEGVVAVLDRGPGVDVAAGGSGLSWRTQRADGGTIFPGSGGSRNEAEPGTVPSATVAVEHYNRMVRAIDRGVPVRAEIDLRVRFHPERGDGNGFNLLAEIPGSDLADEVVMIGAHLDSTHAGTGATDDAAGVAAMMEVMRAFRAAGIRPRRTLRLALWGGEEQGLLGSRAWVERHLVDVEGAVQEDHDGLSAYFNLDNGAGRIRGIWLQDNEAARPVLRSWMELVGDLGVTTIGERSVGGTDHVSLDRAGIPSFQFMQDRLEYNSRTHHSNMDHYDRVPPRDIVQTATVAAIFAYAAAMADDPLPRR